MAVENQKVTKSGDRKVPALLYPLAYIGVVVLVLFAWGVVTQWIANANPISAFLLKHRETCESPSPGCGAGLISMVPDVFAEGEALEAVLRRLSEANYTGVGEGVFRRSAGNHQLVCETILIVRVKFDSAKTLALGEGGAVYSCL